MKVKFCSHGLPAFLKHQKVPINPAWLYIQKWYEIHGKNSQVSWLPPGILLFDPVDVAIDKIVQEQPDVLGLGFYIWNYEFQYQIAKGVKQKLPNTIIVCGGPHLSVHKETENNNQIDFFIEHPYIDYVVYGDGEKPFQQIIDYHAGLLPTTQDFVNIIQNAYGQRKIYPFQVLDDEQYLSQSPYVSQEAHMIEVRDNLVRQGIPFKNQYWAIEFARGCMYSCTFCDWSQNLTKKVKRRQHDWKQDIDLFCRLDVPIRETDANFGQWPDDIKAYDYAISLYDPARNFSFVVNNTPKLKKSVTEYIITQNSLVYNEELSISLQDYHDTVLTAIDRPSVPWASIAEMINNLKLKLPTEKFAKIKLETILGLPGQTVDNIIESYVEFFRLGLTRATYQGWYFLPNSPAADVSYIKLWGLDIKEVYYVVGQQHVPSLQDLYSDLAANGKNVPNFYKKSMVVAHKTMSMLDMWITLAMIRKWNELNQHSTLVGTRTVDQARDILCKLKQLATKEANAQYHMYKPYIDKYNIIVWGHYHPESRTLYGNF
jgi:hypothetical protein